MLGILGILGISSARINKATAIKSNGVFITHYPLSRYLVRIPLDPFQRAPIPCVTVSAELFPFFGRNHHLGDYDVAHIRLLQSYQIIVAEAEARLRFPYFRDK